MGSYGPDFPSPSVADKPIGIQKHNQRKKVSQDNKGPWTALCYKIDEARIHDKGENDNSPSYRAGGSIVVVKYPEYTAEISHCSLVRNPDTIIPENRVVVVIRILASSSQDMFKAWSRIRKVVLGIILV